MPEDAQLPSENKSHLVGYQGAAVSSVLPSACTLATCCAQVGVLLPSRGLKGAAQCLNAMVRASSNSPRDSGNTLAPTGVCLTGQGLSPMTECSSRHSSIIAESPS